MSLQRIFRLTGDWNIKISLMDIFSLCVKKCLILCTFFLVLTATAFAAPLLKQGAEGHDVLILQQNLKTLGYSVEPDGIFGTTTLNAVATFQQDENLPPTGMVDRATWHVLQSRAAQKTEADAAEREQSPASQDSPPAAQASPEIPAAQNVPPASDSEEPQNDKVLLQDPEQENKNAPIIHPKPAILPPPQKTPQQIPKLPNAEVNSPEPEIQAPPAEKTSAKPAPKKEESKSETKETKSQAKMENISEQVPFLPKGKVDDVIKTAKKYTGTKYIFGGTTPKGFDCSGFVQYVFKQNGFSLPRTADEQYKLGKRVKKRAELEPGDLVFFSTYEKGASHCGIYLGNNQFIHVSSSKGVRADSLDDSYWKPRWYGGKHIVK